MNTTTGPATSDAKAPLFDLWLNRFKQLDVKHKGLLIAIPVSVMVLLLIILTIVIYQENSVSQLMKSENKQGINLLHQLRDIDNELQTLTTSPQNSDAFKNALVKLDADLANFQKSIHEVAKSNDIQKLSMQIAEMKEEVDSQITDLKRTVANGQDAKQYLDSKILPFHVISIDVIAQQPFVSINYANHITPFAVGDTVAGWQIASADYDAAQVEFKNDKNQYVKVVLQG